LSQGPVDALVNNAGVERTGSIEELPLAAFRTCMETNYFGVIRCSQAVVRHMRERGSGCIVNVSSVGGRISSAPLTPYAASKFAVEALSEGLAQEMKPFGVRVAIVQPGIIDTRMARNIGDMANSKIYPHGRRFAAMFAASLTQAPSGALVGEKIRDIIESGTWTLRHPVGPDAAPFLAWRASMSDEQWTNWNSQSDADWLAAMKKDFGMDLKLPA
jgi:NAD(P)-dependent dehydrogenase (short-subunit alcohol dehydrogenase family)